MITIVTAFFDIGRGSWNNYKRSTDQYFENFKRLTKLDNPIILFTESIHKEKLGEIKKDNLKIIYIDDLFEKHKDILNKIQNIQQSNAFRNGINDLNCPEYNYPEYVLINYLKSTFCQSAIEANLVKTKFVSWIDFGYLRKKTQLPISLVWDYDFEDKIIIFNLLPIPSKLNLLDTIKTNKVYIQGCHIVAPIHKWQRLKDLMENSLNNLISKNLIDDDQTLLLLSYYESPDDFNVIKAKINKRLDWFFIFHHYNKEKNITIKKILKYYF